MLGLARSTVYYLPKPLPESDLVLTRRIDELHLGHPFAGSRMMRDLLRAEGSSAGRRRIRRLMKKMGIEVEALYRRANTSRRNQAHRIYPYLLRGLSSGSVDQPAEPGLGDGHHLRANEARLRVSLGRAGLGHPQGSGLAALEQSDAGILCLTLYWHQGGVVPLSSYRIAHPETVTDKRLHATILNTKNLASLATHFTTDLRPKLFLLGRSQWGWLDCFWLGSSR